MNRIASILLLFICTIGTVPAQISITFCPSLDSKEAPNVRLGEAYMPGEKPECGYCSEMSCELAMKDPIGGFNLGYYVYKDKERDKWSLMLAIGDYENLVKGELEANIATLKPKLQDKKSPIQLCAVPLNPHLYRIEDELTKLLQDSRQKFQTIQHENKPFGDLAYIFDDITVREKFTKLTATFKGSNQTAAYMNVFETIVDSLFWGYKQQRLGDTLIRCSINPEYPSFEISIDPKASVFSWTIFGPQQADGPQMLFGDKLRRGQATIDTLVSQKSSKGNDVYWVELVDQSEIIQFQCDQVLIPLQTNNGVYVEIEARPELKLKTIILQASDVHGNLTSKEVLLLPHEAEQPKVGFLSLIDNKYHVPGETVTLDKFNNEFVLMGKITDDSPIRSIKINDSPLKLEHDNLFTYRPKSIDNGKKMKIEVVDVHGNRLIRGFSLEFKETGLDRRMKPTISEEFAIVEERHLKRNGQYGLGLQIKDHKFYIERKAPLDDASSGENAEPQIPNPIEPKVAIVPLGFAPLDFSGDFELTATYSQLVDNSRFCFIFGMNETEDSYYFVYGEHDNIFLGQLENGKYQCYAEGCSQNALNTVYSSYEYLTRERVKPSFFGQGTKVNYTLRIKRYNAFYLGAKDDPQDYLFVQIDNNIDTPVEFRWQLKAGDVRIPGTKCGFGLESNSHLAVSSIHFKKGDAAETSAFAAENEAEKYCFPTCYKVDSTKGTSFFDCISDDYHALIVANGDFNGRFASLDSTVSRGRQLYDQLVNQYQFKADNVHFLENATKEQLLTEIETKLPSHLTSKDKLLIYIISHGKEDKTIECKDAAVRSADLWSRLNEDGKYKCHQILVVIDACYSGKMVTSSQQQYNPNRRIIDAVNNRARLVITSASSSPTMESLWTKQLIQNLRTNDAKFITIDRLFDRSAPQFIKDMNGNATPTMTNFDPTSDDSNPSFLFAKKDFFH